MKVDLIATGGGRYRVMRGGVEVSAHTTQHTAFARGIAEKQLTPGALIEVVTDFRVRVEITGQAVEPAPVDPVVPDPVVPDPEPEPDPDPVVPPVILPPYTGDSLLLEQASTMQPGEWRNLAHLTTWPGKDTGRSFKSFQTVSWLSGTEGRSADGMGWTQACAYHQGEMGVILGRDGSMGAFLHMTKRGVFSRLEDVFDGQRVGRRPFNRLTQDDTHAYFSMRHGTKTEMGYFMRTPLDNPGAFERYGIPIGDGQMDTVGNFACTYVPDWGRFYAYTPGGKIYSWAHGDAAWYRHANVPKDADGVASSGYAGILVWNPIKKELIITGGQEFGSTPQSSYKVYRMTDAMGNPEMLEDRRKPDGSLMYWGSGSSRMMVHPHDGSYIIMRDNMLYWNADAGGTWKLYEDATVSRPFGPYENYAPLSLIPGTDVFAFISHMRGLVLHRVKPIEMIGTDPVPVDPEPEDPIDPDPTDPVEPVDPEPDVIPDPPPAPPPSGELAGSSLQIKADALAPGEWAFALGAATFDGVWTRGALNNNSNDGWAPVAVWNPVQARMYGVLDRTAGSDTVESVVIPFYDAASDSWGNVPIPQLGGKFGSPHVYGRWALDIRRQKMYRRSQDDVWELDLASHVWTSTGPRNSAWGDGIAMHEGTGELMYMVGDGTVFAWNPDTNLVRTVGRNPAAQHRHSHGHYNATRDEVCFSFGDGGNVMTLVSADGSVRAVTVPVEVREGGGSSSVFTFYDPVSGHYLVYHRDPKKLWEFDPDSGQWAMAFDFVGSDVGWPPYHGHLIAPVPELGVIMWLHRSLHSDNRHQRIYKHKPAN